MLGSMWWMLFGLFDAQASDSLFVHVRSARWNVVFRSSSTETRVERLAARCGNVWVNACSSRVGSEQRRRALAVGLQPGVQPRGGFQTCRDLVLPPASTDQLRRSTLQIDNRAFCSVLAPGVAIPSEPGLRTSAARPVGGPPAPPPLRPPPSTVSLGQAPTTTATRAGAPQVGPVVDIPTATTASSLDELDLDDFELPERSVDPKEEKRKKRKGRREEEPSLRDRRLPQ